MEDRSDIIHPEILIRSQQLAPVFCSYQEWELLQARAIALAEEESAKIRNQHEFYAKMTGRAIEFDISKELDESAYEATKIFCVKFRVFSLLQRLEDAKVGEGVVAAAVRCPDSCDRIEVRICPQLCQSSPIGDSPPRIEVSPLTATFERVRVSSPHKWFYWLRVS